MILSEVFVRFYKSFNYDYLRKYNPKVEIKYPWEYIGNDKTLWYPYVRVSLEQDVTTVVGANESGKSQLLSAIFDGLKGEKFHSRDFCRYSPFFSVEAGKMMEPQFGFHWTSLTSAERLKLQEYFKISSIDEDIYIFRPAYDQLRAYVGGVFEEYVADPEKIRNIYDLFPTPWRIDPKLVLPNSIPIQALLHDVESGSLSAFEQSSRPTRYHTMEVLDQLLSETSLFNSESEVKSNAATIHSQLVNLSHTLSGHGGPKMDDSIVRLTNDLICIVGGIDRHALAELYHALKNGEDAYANGLIERINRNLSSNLNFRRWWSQDKDFKLSITARDQDIVFTIRDRTNTEYGFSERSNGLLHFLSYYIQYRAHNFIDGKHEILLMDEPDAFLSSQAQQDLLKIFDAFAYPGDKSRSPMQVVYVTHSPFLIDKNRGHRIRVLEKGVDEEGTRVVRDASRNHYEPLRSSLGAFVAETTFIGNCNIMLEGMSDQILIAGIAGYMALTERPTADQLDLNNITLVPAGSAGHIPYLVYLAKGRDIEKPAVIVLLDGDQSGKEAYKLLLKGPPKYKEILADSFILRVDSLSGIESGSGNVLEIEDLIPLELYIKGVKSFLSEVVRLADDDLSKLTTEYVLTFKEEGKSIYDITNSAIAAIIGSNFSLDKIAAARGLIDYLRSLYQSSARLEPAQEVLLKKLEQNMALLYKALNHAKELALDEISKERMGHKIKRILKAFEDDHKLAPTREACKRVLDGILSSLDESKESNSIRKELSDIILEFELEIDQTKPVRDFMEFRDRIRQLQHLPRNLTQEHVHEDPSIPKSILSAVQNTPQTLNNTTETSTAR